MASLQHVSVSLGELSSPNHVVVADFFLSCRNLASTLRAKNPHSEHIIPELQTQSLTSVFSEQLIADRIARLNEFLEVVTKADEFQWGIRIDKDTCVYKRKSRRGSNASAYTASRESFYGRESFSNSMISVSRASTISMNDAY